MTTEEKIRALKNKLKECDTESILGNLSLTYITQADVDGLIDRKTRFIDSELMSPQKQRLYLAGLLMSTEYSGKSPVYDENRSQYKTLEDDIQSITFDYIKGFLDFDKEPFDPTDEALREELKKRHVSMEAFISYFDTGILRYEEQTVDLIDPFDQELLSLTSLRVADYISFYEFTKDKI